MTTNNASRKIKSLELVIEHLKLELEELNEELREYSLKFTNELYEIVDQETQNTNSAVDHPVQEFIELVDKPTLPDDLKKLWKKIASITHPDKTGNNLELAAKYKKAAVAVATASTSDLVRVAVELGIEPPETASELTINALTQLKQRLTDRLIELRNSVLIRWGREKDESERKSILNFYIEAKGYTRKNCNS